MDAHRKLKETDADKALRDLFRASGQVVAPVGMDARILQRIAVVATPALKPEAALLPKWVWGALVVGLVGLTAYLLANSSGAGPGVLSQYFGSIPSFSFVGIFSSPWLWMGCGSLVMLLGLDVVLERKRSLTLPSPVERV